MAKTTGENLLTESQCLVAEPRSHPPCTPKSKTLSFISVQILWKIWIFNRRKLQCCSHVQESFEILFADYIKDRQLQELQFCVILRTYVRNENKPFRIHTVYAPTELGQNRPVDCMTMCQRNPKCEVLIKSLSHSSYFFLFLGFLLLRWNSESLYALLKCRWSIFWWPFLCCEWS